MSYLDGVHYDGITEENIKQRNDILTYVILKDLLTVLVCELNNVLKASNNTIKVFEKEEIPKLTVPQYIIEDTSDEIIIYRSNY